VGPSRPPLLFPICVTHLAFNRIFLRVLGFNRRLPKCGGLIDVVASKCGDLTQTNACGFLGSS
jgi:hypothetical protein